MGGLRLPCQSSESPPVLIGTGPEARYIRSARGPPNVGWVAASHVPGLIAMGILTVEICLPPLSIVIARGDGRSIGLELPGDASPMRGPLVSIEALEFA